MGKDFSQNEMTALLGRAGELGLNLIDTAECYGDHLAESLVGRAIAGQRDLWVVATKFGHRFHAERMQRNDWDPVTLRAGHWSPQQVIEQLDESLRALGTDYVDIYQSHGGSDEQFRTPGLWKALQQQVRAGKIRLLGVSLDPEDAERVRRAPDLGAEVVQVTFNRLNRIVEQEVLPAARELGLGVLAREPLANGYLSGKYRAGNRITGASDWHSHQDPDEVAAKLGDVERIVGEELPSEVPLAQWALAWCLQQPAISAVIPGVKTLEQLESNAAAAELDLVAEDRPPPPGG